MGTWGNQCTLLVCVAHSIPRGKYFLLFYYLNVNKLISFQSFAVVYPYDNRVSHCLFSLSIVKVNIYFSILLLWYIHTPYNKNTPPYCSSDSGCIGVVFIFAAASRSALLHLNRAKNMSS